MIVISMFSLTLKIWISSTNHFFRVLRIETLRAFIGVDFRKDRNGVRIV